MGRCCRAAGSLQGGTPLDDACAADRLWLLEKGGSCLPPIAAVRSEPKSRREQVPLLPPAWSSHLQCCVLQSQPLLLFPIAFGKPTKSIPRWGLFFILIFSLPFAEEGASFALRASLRRQNQNPAMHRIARNAGIPPSPSPAVPAQLVSLPAPGLPRLLFPCRLPGTRTAKGVCEV